MTEQNMFKVRIEGEGLIFEREIPKEIGEQVMILILSGSAPVAAIPKPTSNTATIVSELPASPQKNLVDLSIREYLDEHNAKRNPDIITAIGYYLLLHDRQQTFTKEDLLNAFEAAAEPTPKNLPRDLRWAIKVGWVAEKRDVKDSYYITSSGKSAVDTSFPDELIKKTKIPLRPKKASSKKDKESEE